MKFIFSLLILIATTKECKNKEAVQKQEDHITITYQASSRGVFEEIAISKDSLVLCNDVNRNSFTTYTYDKKEWNECLELLENINVSQLPKLKAPTGKRLYDGALHAILTIKSEEGEVTSSSFDHGEPPAEIKALVEKLLSIKKVASEQ